MPRVKISSTIRKERHETEPEVKLEPGWYRSSSPALGCNLQHTIYKLIDQSGHVATVFCPVCKREGNIGLSEQVALTPASEADLSSLIDQISETMESSKWWIRSIRRDIRRRKRTPS